MGKDRLLPIFAILILLISGIFSTYIYTTQATTNTLLVNGQQYTIDQLFFLAQLRTMNESQYTGIALNDLMLKTGITNPEQHTYTLRGSDGYEKTVTWENMKNGLLTKDGQSIFSDLPKAFRVKNVITIEVN
jgi:hypothetical protein